MAYKKWQTRGKIRTQKLCCNYVPFKSFETKCLHLFPLTHPDFGNIILVSYVCTKGPILGVVNGCSVRSSGHQATWTGTTTVAEDSEAHQALSMT